MAKMKIKVHERNSDTDPQRFYDKLNPVEKSRFDGLADTVEALVGVFDENGKLSKPQQDQLKEARDTIYVFGYAARGYVSLADEVLATYGVEPLLDPNEPVFGESKKNEDTDDAAEALAKELGVSVDKVSDSSQDYDHYEPDYVLDVDLNGEKAVFVVYDNQQSAYDAAVDDLEEQFRDDSAILGAAIAYFGIDTFKDFIDAGESDLDEIESLSGDMGSEEFAKFIQEQVAPYFNVDYRGFAEYNIDRLEIAWHLADYDSKEVELENGMLAYRVE